MSTYDTTYSGVVHRHLSQIPRLATGDLQGILGPKAGLAAAGGDAKVKRRHLQEVKQAGNPVFWAEYKPVDLWSNLFRSMGATEIFDLTPGSGAAAIAALHCGIKYEGVCINANHKQWLETMLDKAIYAVALESPESATAVGVTQECVANIKLFFQGTVKEAKRYLLASGGDSNVPDPADDADQDDEESSGGESNA
jgi:hypothetical protein